MRDQLIPEVHVADRGLDADRQAGLGGGPHIGERPMLDEPIGGIIEITFRRVG
ncbi:hypothetical protein [Mycobacteroides franklinii]|uniref:hypothetical protein n=1 Tax=Mycobacteroides franklinii TaxID=948102 RepID=UPI0018E32D29|nr:hypothetical protein [Mycobacteroides franklinii]